MKYLDEWFTLNVEVVHQRRGSVYYRNKISLNIKTYTN